MLKNEQKFKLAKKNFFPSINSFSQRIREIRYAERIREALYKDWERDKIS